MPAWISNNIHPKKVWGKMNDPFPASTVQPVKFGNVQIILSHTLLGMWLLLGLKLNHVGIKVKPY